MELPLTVIIGLGVIASAITVVLRWLSVKYPKYVPSRFILNAILYVVALIAGYVVVMPMVDVSPADVPAYVNALLSVGLLITGAATLAYNLLLQKVVYPLVGLKFG